MRGKKCCCGLFGLGWGCNNNDTIGWFWLDFCMETYNLLNREEWFYLYYYGTNSLFLALLIFNFKVHLIVVFFSMLLLSIH